MKRPSWLRRRDPLARELETALTWGPPATAVCVAGVHGGAGATTLTLLLGELVAVGAGAPVLTIDLAGHSRGGLAVLSGVAGQTTAEGAAAAAVVHGAPLERPFGVGDRGVRVLGAAPDGVVELDRSYENLASRLAGMVRAGTVDERLGVREALGEARVWEALRWDNDQLTDAIGTLLDRSRTEHALVVVDLGMRDSDRIADAVQSRCGLLVWVLPARSTSFEIARRRLAHMPFGACREAIAVWQDGDRRIPAHVLSDLGDIRGCPVVRLAHHGDGDEDWSVRTGRCLSGLLDLCDLAR